MTKGHGRIETRAIWTSADLTDYTPFPFAAQVFRIERTITHLDGTPRHHEVVYGVTSLGADRADAARVLALQRGHWGIENRLHWVRDVTFDDDRSQVRTGAGPHVMATLRNVVIGVLRLAGCRYLPTGLRACARNPSRPLRLIGVTV